MAKSLYMYKIEIAEENPNLFEVIPKEGTEQYEIHVTDRGVIGTIWPVLSLYGIEWFSDNFNLNTILVDKLGQAIEHIER